MVQPTKTCSQCGETKPLSEFYKQKNYKDGYRGKCRNCFDAYNKERVKKLKLEIFTHYSGNPPVCQCCGETTFEFLSIDHIKNDGAEHRRNFEGAKILGWIKNSGFPPIFQVLCRNCNWAKYAYGVCPHQTKYHKNCK